CNFFICERLKGRSRGGLAYSAWAEYRFPGVGGDKIKKPFVFSESQAQRLTVLLGVALEESEAGSSSNIRPQNFCYFGRRPMTNLVRLSGFLSIWLAKCVDQTRKAVMVGVLLSATRLACGVRITLVPAVIANIQHGLREVAASC